MENLFQKMLYTGVGFVASASEKIQKSVDQLVAENKISTAEGKKIVEDFVSKTEGKKEEFEAKLKEITEAVVERFDFPSRKDYQALVKRVEALEATVAKSKTTTKTATKPVAKATKKAKA